MRDLERHGNDGPRIAGQRGFRHQDLVIAVGEALDDFRGELLAREVEEILLDVLDLQRALMLPVLFDQILGHEA